MHEATGCMRCEATRVGTSGEASGEIALLTRPNRASGGDQLGVVPFGHRL